MGYSFNLMGSMMYTSFAQGFLAQLYHIELSAARLITLMLVLLLASKGMAGVPRADLMGVAAGAGQAGILEAGVLLVGAEHFLDMGRTATNVIGNSIATAMVSRCECDLEGADRTQPEESAGAVSYRGPAA